MALPEFRVAGTVSGGPPRVQRRIVKAAETFDAGQCVQIDVGTGHLEECASGAEPYGVALDSAANGLAADDLSIPVALWSPDTIFSGGNTGVAYAATDLNANTALEVAAGVHGVNNQTIANPCMKVLGVDTTDTASERLLVCPMPNESEAEGGEVAPA